MFLTIFFMIPIYGLLIWTYFYPEESMLLGQRWMYKEEPEFSEMAIGYTKFASGIGMFILTIALSSSFFNNPFVGLFFILGLFCYIIYGVYKLDKKILK
ncbi:hypothetical protein N0O92_13025 [Alkalihalobacillus sp. MEB130]|uniref:hypothetical protein n=1 Tax=Alkalihalobacillus sp. MEB130 TaxID=2976704 RepID=UPI0028DE49CE|nr:hypothetical protein [Alkalihalobacillus sp. MEB130]MDT8861158.1 hypothetical protein [Alkalihalobacillus sp. MEB130]